MESVGKRQSSAPLKILEQQLDSITENLDRVCSENITEYMDDVEKLRSLSNIAKKYHTEYDAISKQLLLRYNSTASVFMSEEIRKVRRLKRKDCHDFISVIKSRLEVVSSDVISNIDLQSLAIDRCEQEERDLTLLDTHSDQQVIAPKIKYTCATVSGDSKNIETNTCLPQPAGQQEITTCTPIFSTSNFPDIKYSSATISGNYIGTNTYLTQPTVPKVHSYEQEISSRTDIFPTKSNYPDIKQPCAATLGNSIETSIYLPRHPMLYTTIASHIPIQSNVIPHTLPLSSNMNSAGLRPTLPAQNSAMNSHYMTNYNLQPTSSVSHNLFDQTSSPFSSNIRIPHSSIAPQAPNNSSQNIIYEQNYLVRELNKITLDPFDGSACSFWSWFGRIKQKINSVQLDPLHILLLLQENTTGPPKKMIKDHILARGEITHQDVSEICRLLKQRYGSSSKISEELMIKLKHFPQVKDHNQGIQLQALYDLCKIINFNIPHNAELQLLNIAEGLKIIRSKLPEKIQEEWRQFGQAYKSANCDSHPPFSEFVIFLEKKANELADNDFTIFHDDSPIQYRRVERIMRTNSGDELGASDARYDDSNHCVFHDRVGHSITECKAFSRLPYVERKRMVFDLKICFRCLGPHFISECQAVVKCDTCNKEHVTVMHQSDDYKSSNLHYSRTEAGRDSNENKRRAMCMTLCSNPEKRKNCSKVVLVDISMSEVPNKVLRAYAIIDDQSNTSLVDEKVVKFFNRDFPKRDYTLSFASQKYEMSETGFLVTGLKVSCIKTRRTIQLPQLLSTTEMANTKNEVADPAIVRAHPHIKHLASHFNDIDKEAEVLLLIGRDCGEAMLCESYSKKEPYVYKTPLGWTLVGETCVSDKTGPINRALHTSVCTTDHIKLQLKLPSKNPLCNTDDPFEMRNDDDEPGLSVEDKIFIEIMSSEVTINKSGSIQLPIPFRETSPLPNNKNAVYHRTKNTLGRLQRDPVRLKSCMDSVEQDLKAGHLEVVPSEEQNPLHKAWWLPIFPVFNPKKNKTRLVYDASAKYSDVSLNDTMIQGPDFNNTLRGVLLRFREHRIGFISDIEKMFNSFALPPNQRDCYRFFWYKNNDCQQSLVQYRSTCHLFGSRSSPAIANFGLKYTANQPIADHYPEAVPFIRHGFYVDDGIYSTPSIQKAVETIKGAIEILKKFNIRLHKILCSSHEVLKEFPTSEIASGLRTLDNKEPSYTRTLGVGWDPTEDCFFLQVHTPDRPFTKRGILSVVNSLYDPLGIASPVILTGKLIQRAVLLNKKNSPEGMEQYGWDDILPEDQYSNWLNWLNSLPDIKNMKVVRCFLPNNFELRSQEFHIYSDASEKAIGYVIYVRSVDTLGKVHVCFVEGSSRITPRAATTIPRLELCAAVEAVKGAFKIIKELSRKPDSVYFYTDSRITLGYISNTEKRFVNYIDRRVNSILKHSTKEQWFYIPTTKNPADMASRPHSPQQLMDSHWIRGPVSLWEKDYAPTYEHHAVPADELPEVKSKQTTLKTTVKDCRTILTTLCSKISSLSKIVNVVVVLMKLLNKIDLVRQNLGISLAPRNTFLSFNACLNILIINAQHDCFSHEIKILNNGYSLSDSSRILQLAPFLDTEGILRVGGRLKKSNLSFQSKHPILLPNDHPFTRAVLDDAHNYVNHQGRHITHGVVRQKGYHIVNGRKMIKNLISKCAICQKLRGNACSQLMSDLPEDRVEDIPPFSNIGMDVFGPYLVHDGISTRRTKATKKMWVLIIVCLVSRAVHLEMLFSMDTSSFMNAFSRFSAVRGVAKLIRTDRGTNFICARRQLQTNCLQDVIVELQRHPYEWKLNPPGASHFSGSWERKIHSVKSVLDGSMQCLRQSTISREELSTLLQEAAAIVNNTPLTDVSSYPDDPAPITPANLLTLKMEPNPPTIDKFTQDDILSYGRKRWRRVQQLSQEFWQRWKTEYISSIQQRRKWLKVKPNICIGDVVIVRDKNSPRNCWPVARVTSVKHSQDGLVRSATLKLPPLHGSSHHRFTTRCIHDLVVICSENGA